MAPTAAQEAKEKVRYQINSRNLIKAEYFSGKYRFQGTEIS